jgi:Tol biopolymer transport system component
VDHERANKEDAMNTKYLQSLQRASLLILPIALAATLLVLVQSALAANRPDSLTGDAQMAQQMGGLTWVTSASDGNRDSYGPSLSADGTVVAFESNSDLLNEGRPLAAFEIWLYDTAAVTYTRVTSSSDGFRDSHIPSLNADGTVVAFQSDSDLLNEGRPFSVYEIWLYDTVAMTYTRVTSASHANRDSFWLSLSGDGTVVAFTSDSDFLNEGRPDDVMEIWLYDTATMTCTRVTSASDGLRDSMYPNLNGDGTVVAFYSDSDLLNEGIPDDVYEVWLYNTATMTFTRVTSASDGLRDSTQPRLSADGTVVAFTSDSDLLNEGRPDNVLEIWLYDTVAMTFTRVTSASDGLRDSTNPSLSADGTVVAFESDSDFLNEGRPDDVSEIWLYDIVAMTFTRVTSASDGLRHSINPSLNRDGTMVAFQSDSDFLNEGRLDDVNEIWLWKEYNHVYLPLVLRQ